MFEGRASAKPVGATVQEEADVGDNPDGLV
jgi:hypothetical protein